MGDEYFGATDGVLFSDLDVLAIGAIVPEVSTDFDRYWASASAWPVQALVPAPTAAAAEADRAQLHARAAQIGASSGARTYTEALRQTPFITDLLVQPLALHWSRIHIVSDDPAKGLGLAPRSGLLVDQLYRVLTNAYEASDVPLVHAGYAQYRPALLQSGVALYEKQRLAPKKPGVRLNPLGSSGSSLHAKTFAVDGERAFVGSFNFDPRSALLNTELGFVIDSPLLAGQIEQAFATNVPQSAYTLGLSGTGEVQWHSPDDGLHTTEPGSRWWSRLGLRLLALLPIEWLL